VLIVRARGSTPLRGQPRAGGAKLPQESPDDVDYDRDDEENPQHRGELFEIPRIRVDTSLRIVLPPQVVILLVDRGSVPLSKNWVCRKLKAEFPRIPLLRLSEK
jgi:hypothetical protein